MKKENTICLEDWLVFLEGGVEKNKKLKLLFTRGRSRRR